MFCPKCGNQVTADEKFCKSCGNSLQGNVSDQSQTPPQTNQQSVSDVPPVLPASVWRRLANNIIDGFAMYVFAILIGLGVGVIFGKDVGMVLSFIVFFFYFFFFELAFQRTIGKFLTGTKVVKKDGERPGVLTLLGRSLARYIPFEAFSFLFYGKYPIQGWHDRLSNTVVVPVGVTPEQVKNTDWEKVKEYSKKTPSVLLIVIGVLAGLLILLGVFAAIAMSSLSDARDRGSDAGTKANVANMRVKAEIYYDSNNGSYEGFCEDVETDPFFSSDVYNIDYTCNDAPKEYALATELVNGGYFCVDSTGQMGEIEESLMQRTSCPATE